MAWKLKISWKEGAKDKPEVGMNGEIRNVTSLPLAIRNTNEFKFFTKLSEGLENWLFGEFYFLEMKMTVVMKDLVCISFTTVINIQTLSFFKNTAF